MEIKNLIVCGPIWNDDGYSAHILGLSKALNKIIPVQLLCDKPQGWEVNIQDRELYEMLLRNYDIEESTVINIGLPPYWDFVLSQNPRHFIGFLVFEGDKIPSHFVPHCNNSKVEMIFVPSIHTKNAAIASGVFPEKIKIIPHGVSELFYPKKDRVVDDKAPFNILFCKGWNFSKGENDRGNFPFVLKAFAKAFSREDNVIFTAKFNRSYIPSNISLEQAIAKIGVDMSKCPPCRFILDNVPFDKLVGIYQLADGGISIMPSKSDGFGLTALESMKCQIPVIVGEFSGMVDFVNENNGWILPIKEMKQAQDGLLYEEIKWAEYDIEQLATLMRWCHEHRNIVKKKGEQAYKDALLWSWDNSAKKVLEIIKEIK